MTYRVPNVIISLKLHIMPTDVITNSARIAVQRWRENCNE